ncbi:MAG: DEAD/DEAH box helicase family protein [Rhodovibrionaceae bacterium]
MSPNFFEQPVINSPYDEPARHWELDEDGQPTNLLLDSRRSCDFISPVPKPKKRKTSKHQAKLDLDEGDELSDVDQDYTKAIINEIRGHVENWRRLPNPEQWQVTPETARLLQHWRSYRFEGIRPFFCQIEAAETIIWLTEVAPKSTRTKERFWAHIRKANEQANPELIRLAMKMATGSGKTSVMAMLIAWQTVNAVRHPNNKQFSRGFLIVCPGITIRDRLRVLLPNDTESYYRHRELVPSDMLQDIDKAKIVITNYHAFKRREKISIAAGTRKFIQGRGPKLETLESEGEMIRRVMPDLMGMKGIVVLNDEAHHCYRARPELEGEGDLKGEEKAEAKENNEAARLWISGIETVKKQMGLRAVYDLSATPFFLRGSGYAEGTLFPWTVSDFSLMDAIECGIVKLPRIPISDNLPSGEMPMYRNLWEHIGKRMPKKGAAKAGKLDPLSLPTELETALQALYGHYAETFDAWAKNDAIDLPPVFIVVCNNTSTSKMIYDYVSGFYRKDEEEGSSTFNEGRLELLRNYDGHGNRLARPRTLLIDSVQLESGEALDPEFRTFAADEIEQFRREMVERTGDRAAGEKLTDQDLLREVMNTVGKKGRLGESVRCVVSVSMLTEGWDANTVTHILGVRAFGTQLLCEQVVGRALRRQSYDLNEEGLFDPEYADILGIPFDFAAKPVIAKPKPPRETVRVHALPEREELEIRFPRVEGYRVELPEERLDVKFTPEATLTLTPEKVGATKTTNQGIIGEAVNLSVEHLRDLRTSTVIYHLTKHLLLRKYRDAGEEPKLHLFGQLKRITRQWLDGGYLVCKGDTYPGQLLYQTIADEAAEKIKAAITRSEIDERPVKAILDPYNPVGTTRHVNFTTSKALRWKTSAKHCHVNWAVCDSEWEAEFCRVVEEHPRVTAYVKNQGLGLEVPYRLDSTARKYLPDFIVQVDDGQPDPLNLIIEIKGYRGEDAEVKAETMDTYWVPGVNNLGKFGRWAFAEFRDVWEIEPGFDKLIEEQVAKQMAGAAE